MQSTNTYELDMHVRDYELDMQGIVNNAVYLNYLEHARHKFMEHHGLTFAEMNNMGKNPVVVRSEVDYKASLKSGDHFRIKVTVEREGRLKMVFNQQIIRLSDHKTVLKGRIYAVCLQNGRPVEPVDVLQKIGLLEADTTA